MSKSSKKWLNRQFSDPYVERAQKLGYYSRAVFKLEEIQQKTNFIHPSSIVVDLGAAPGAFCQYVQKIAPMNKIIACDLLPIKPIKNITFIQGDFSDEKTYQAILKAIDSKKVDVVLSDISPNLSGLNAVDSAKSMALVELAFEFAKDFLQPDGSLLIKVFQGRGFSELIQSARENFEEVRVYKPKASRKESKEIYLFARNKRI